MYILPISWRLSQSNLPSEEEVASGRQVIPLVGVPNLEPGDLLGVAHAPLMCVPLDALQRPSGPSSEPTWGNSGRCRHGFTSRSCGRHGLALAGLRSCVSGNDCRHICARLHLTFTARTGPL